MGQACLTTAWGAAEQQAPGEGAPQPLENCSAHATLSGACAGKPFLCLDCQAITSLDACRPEHCIDAQLRLKSFLKSSSLGRSAKVMQQSCMASCASTAGNMATIESIKLARSRLKLPLKNNRGIVSPFSSLLGKAARLFHNTGL